MTHYMGRVTNHPWNSLSKDTDMVSVHTDKYLFLGNSVIVGVLSTLYLAKEYAQVEPNPHNQINKRLVESMLACHSA